MYCNEAPAECDGGTFQFQRIVPAGKRQGRMTGLIECGSRMSDDHVV